MVVTPLYDYPSLEQSYLVNSYPYGRKLRCRIRYWIESSPTKGYRFCSQTEHPTTKVWNSPKRGTYYLIAACMYLDEKGYVSYSALSQYSSEKDVREFVKNFPQYKNRSELKVWAQKKMSFTKEHLEGKRKFFINNVAQPVSEHEMEEMKKELLVWEEILSLME